MDHFPEQRTHIGNYRLVKELGRGSMGTVYLAHQESLGRDLALKVMAPEFTRDAEFVERFRREGRVAANLRHPNIVRVFDADCRDGLYFIAMEYLGERNLRQVIEQSAPLPLGRSVRIAEQILSALAHAHEKGIVHRDIKPANVLLQDDDEVTLTDFSIAHIEAGSKLTQTGIMIGTPEYMSPEQFEGRGIDARADLYAAGLVLYEMLTGVNPFRGETTPQVMKAHILHRPDDPCSLVPSIPRALGSMLLKALEKDPAERYQTASEMREALFSAAGHNPSAEPLSTFLNSIERGDISMDEAIKATQMVKEAIDRGFKKRVSVLMVDLAGSSRIKVPNQTLMADQAFREYRATINSVLDERNCSDYNWSGDGAICIFQEARDAVVAGLTIQSELDRVAERHSHLPDRLRARIGINTGEVYMDPRRSLGEFASRTVDHAGHLEKDCVPGQVHVSEVTARLTEAMVDYEQLGVNRDGITVYRALRLKGAAAPHRPQQSLAAPPPPLPAPSTPAAVPTAVPPTPRAPAASTPGLAVAPAPAPSTAPMPPPSTQAPTPPQPVVGPGRPAVGLAPAARPEAPLGAQEFRLWWGWWVAFSSFLLMGLGQALRPNEAAKPFLGVGTLGLTIMVVLAPLAALYYLWQRRTDAAKQAGCAFFAFVGLFILAGTLMMR